MKLSRATIVVTRNEGGLIGADGNEVLHEL
jgi:hypothetical protein